MARKSGKKKKRVAMALHCVTCNSQNYHIRKNVKADYKIEDLNKFCNNCQSYQPHKEKKIPSPFR